MSVADGSPEVRALLDDLDALLLLRRPVLRFGASLLLDVEDKQ